MIYHFEIPAPLWGVAQGVVVSLLLVAHAHVKFLLLRETTIVAVAVC